MHSRDRLAPPHVVPGGLDGRIEQDDGGRRQRSHKPPARLEAVDARHANCDERKAGAERERQLERLLGGGGFADHVEARRTIHDHTRGAPSLLLVVHGQHPHTAHRA